MFKDSELSFYSLQVYVKKEDASLNNFPIIGYQDAGSKSMLFTKYREITVDEFIDNDDSLSGVFGY